MRYALLFALAMIFQIGHASETIWIKSPYSPGHSATPVMLKLVEDINQKQTKYKFILEFKPGGNQAIAVRDIHNAPGSSLAIIAPAFAENIEQGLLDKSDYVPIFALGDACWAVISNLGNDKKGIESLKGQKSLMVGGVGVGNATHLTALAIGEYAGLDVTYVVFKSNNDALINMVGGNGVNLVIDKIEAYEALRSKNPNIKVLAASCPVRLQSHSNIKTLREQGINAPYIFNILVSHRIMDMKKQKEIQSIFVDATTSIGEKEFFRLSGMRPPQFDYIDTETFYKKSLSNLSRLRSQYKSRLQN